MGANVNRVDQPGRALLSRASEGVHEDTAWLLLDEGVNVESANRYGRTSSSWAAWKGEEVIVELLPRGDGDITSADNRRRKPIMVC